MPHTLFSDSGPKDANPFQLNSVSSRTIKAARFGCIFFMCFVHVLGKQYISTPPLLFAESIVIDVFGRASVPLLSAISGYLAVVSLSQTSLLDIARKKLKSLIVPMAFWNVLVILVGVALFALLGVSTGFYEHIQTRSPFEILTQSILALNYESVQVSHRFLRDVFVCFLLFPLINKATQMVGPLVLIFVLVIIYTTGTDPIIYREHIILFFVLGILAAHYRISVQDMTKFWPVTLPLLAVVIVAQLYAPLLTWLQDLWIDYNVIKRLIVAHAMLCLAQKAAARLSEPSLDTLSEIAFIGFLMHNLFLTVAYAPFMIFGTDTGPILYPLYFFTAPVALWGAAYVVRKIIQYVPKALQRIAFGRSYKIRPKPVA